MQKRAYKYVINTLLILLLGVWVLHFIYPVYYSVAVLKVRAEQKEEIEHRDPLALEKLCFEQASFKKYYDPQSKELNINGDLYDVSRIETEGETVTCYVLKDKEETRLNKRISSEQQHHRSIKNIKMANCWWPLVVLYTNYATDISYPLAKEAKARVAYNDALLKGYISGLLQPPRYS